MEAGEVRSGHRVLDVACGTGVVAREAVRAAGPSGKVVGLDVNAPMLQMARRFAEQEGMGAIEWQHGDASAMPLADAA